MKKLLLVVFIILLTGVVWARDRHTDFQKKFVGDNEKLAAEMNALLIKMSELDPIVEKKRMFENDIHKEQAERIIYGIEQIRKLDKKRCLWKGFK